MFPRLGRYTSSNEAVCFNNAKGFNSAKGCNNTKGFNSAKGCNNTKGFNNAKGFTLIELMIVIAIMAAASAAAVPAMGRMYDAMQYRDAVRAVLAGTKAARFKALSSGRAVDWVYVAGAREIHVHNKLQQTLSEDFQVDVTSARELSEDNRRAVIRFYPDGSSSGGDISLEHETGKGLKIKVDWLFGRISQHPLSEEFI